MALRNNEDRRESFVNVRVRMQRLSDAKFYSGWLRSMSESEVVIDFAGSEVFEPDTKFFLSINGVNSAAVVQTQLASQTPGFLNLRYDGQVKYLNPSEQARRLVTGLTGVIEIAGGEIDMQITDVSVKGFGALIEGVILKGSIVTIQIDTQFGNVTAQAEIRYCRQDSKDSMRHRVGFQITQIGRIENARWGRLTEEGVA
ncbi:MAG TPA: PilZ domain-containing protein [Fimbriimonas sp.]|nr:PilZ domain-containing protein [Fimbriimonas sp.]